MIGLLWVSCPVRASWKRKCMRYTTKRMSARNTDCSYMASPSCPESDRQRSQKVHPFRCMPRIAFPKKVPCNSCGMTLVTIFIHGLATSPEPNPCQISIRKISNKGGLFCGERYVKCDDGKSKIGNTLVDRHPQHEGLYRLAARCPTGGQQLGQLPADVVDGPAPNR